MPESGCDLPNGHNTQFSGHFRTMSDLEDPLTRRAHTSLACVELRRPRAITRSVRMDLTERSRSTRQARIQGWPGWYRAEILLNIQDISGHGTTWNDHSPGTHTSLDCVELRRPRGIIRGVWRELWAGPGPLATSSSTQDCRVGISAIFRTFQDIFRA